jgi:hypothetical protein
MSQCIRDLEKRGNERFNNEESTRYFDEERQATENAYMVAESIYAIYIFDTKNTNSKRTYYC